MPFEQKTHENANCLHEFVHRRCSKCPPFAWTHAWRHFLHWSFAVLIMPPGMCPCKLIWVLLQIYRSLQQQKNFAYRSRIDIVIAMVRVAHFFDLWCIYMLWQYCFAVKRFCEPRGERRSWTVW